MQNRTHMMKEIMEQDHVLDACKQYNEKVMEGLAKAIKDFAPESVVFAARGTSDHAATFARYIFEIYCSIPVSLAAPSVITAYGNESLNLSRSLVIGISQSGAAADANAVISTARKQGGLTVTVTNTLGSLMAENADYHIYCNAGKEESVAATKSFLTSIYPLTWLAAQLSGNQELVDSLARLPKAVSDALALNEEIANTAKTFRFMDECFVLSRGICYPIAMEAALKIQETSYVRGRCYSVSDFHHGPFAMVSEHTPVIIIAVDKYTNGDAGEMIQKLKKAQAYTLVITTDKDLAGQANDSILLPEWMNHIEGAFAAAIVAQQFACHLAVLKGNNPDQPRGLNKVTVTL